MIRAVQRGLFLWRFTRQWRWRLLLAFVALSLVSGASLAYPWLLKMMADRYAGTPGLPDPGLLAVLLATAFILASVLGYLQQVELQSLGYRLRNILRVEFFRTLLIRPMQFFSDQRAGELSARATEDFSRLQPLFANLIAPLVQSAIVMAGCVFLMGRISIPAASGVLLLMVLPLPFVLGLSRSIMNNYATSTADHAAANAVLEESLVGIREVKAFAREEHQVARYAALHHSAFHAERASARLHARVTQSVYLLFSLLLVAIFSAATSGTLLSGWTIGNVIAFYFYAYTFAMATVAAGKVVLVYQGIAGAFERSFQLMHTGSPVPIRPLHAPPYALRGTIEFRDVEFSYHPGSPVLRGASFTIGAGSTVLIEGASGSGKSTLVNLLIGLYTPDVGTILIDGEPLDHYDLFALRKSMGYVGQEPVLFHGTVRENILLGGSDSGDHRLAAILALTRLEEVLASLRGGLDAVIGERGQTLSGGQRSRIAIARAAIHRPPILILDEAGAMLGEEIERRLWPSLLDDRKGLTTIILTHHREFLPLRYRRLVLRNGRVTPPKAPPRRRTPRA